jgi:hypothetical protein
MDKNEGRKSKRDCEIQEDMKRKKLTATGGGGPVRMNEKNDFGWG